MHSSLQRPGMPGKSYYLHFTNGPSLKEITYLAQSQVILSVEPDTLKPSPGPLIENFPPSCYMAMNHISFFCFGYWVLTGVDKQVLLGVQESSWASKQDPSASSVQLWTRCLTIFVASFVKMDTLELPSLRKIWTQKPYAPLGHERHLSVSGVLILSVDSQSFVWSCL